MHIIKIGGSLSRDPLLPDWLQRLCAFGGGRVVIVPGGGDFADQVRDHQAHWGFGDLPAHNMAVLAMAQFGLMLQGLCPALRPAADEDAIRAVLRAGGVAVWLPYGLLREQPDEMTNWDATSDSVAAWLCHRLAARRLVLVKSCQVEAGLTPEDYAHAGVVDRAFAHHARQAPYSIEILHKSALARMEQLLQDTSPCPAGPRAALASPLSGVLSRVVAGSLCAGV